MIQKSSASLRPMNCEEIAEYRVVGLRNYVADIARARNISTDAAMKIAQPQFEHMFPDDRLQVDDRHLYTVDANGQRVGWVVFMTHTRFGAPRAMLVDIEILEEMRGLGHGKQAMLAMEEKVKELGLEYISLEVFAHSTPAQELYEKLGYHITHVGMERKVN